MKITRGKNHHFERVKDEIGSQWHKVIATVSKGGVTVPHLGRTIESGIKN